MTVKELLETLKDLPEDTEIIMAKDAGGFRFGPLFACEKGMYTATGEFNGTFVSHDEPQSDGIDFNAVWLYGTL